MLCIWQICAIFSSALSSDSWNRIFEDMKYENNLHFTTDYTCMIVYVTNNKEHWTNFNCLNNKYDKKKALLNYYYNITI